MKESHLLRKLFRVCVVAALVGCGTRQGQSDMPPTAMVPSGDSSWRATASYRVLYSFREHHDGTHPSAGVIVVNGALYGTTGGGGSAGGGTVYRLTTTGHEKVLHSFGRGSDGAGPRSSLIDVNGTLYGTTHAGGAFNKGTVYGITTSGVEKVLYSFSGGSDGAHPEGGLLNVAGALYGTTMYGGTGCGGVGCGTVYRISTAGSEKVLHRFKGWPVGTYWPESRLRAVNGVLFGTTYLGGGTGCYRRAGCGAVFSVTRTGIEKLVYRFGGRFDGRNPLAGLTNVDGALYGTTTAGGGPSDEGTVFKLTMDGQETVLHRFSAHHSGGLDPGTAVKNVHGTVYGTTTAGGSSDDGTIYSMTLNGDVTILHDFTGGTDGLYPQGDLVYYNGTLYGTTYYDGGGGAGTCCGTVFSLRLK
jgi:uncharacterized repeat protein (TIGR03803 family)